MAKVKHMEFKDMLKDPRLLTADPYYGKLGPIGLCEFTQEEYSTLFSDQEWSALTSTIPAVNNLTVDESRDKGDTNLGGRKCYGCDSNTHLHGSIKCSKYEASREKMTRDVGGGDGGGNIYIKKQ